MCRTPCGEHGVRVKTGKLARSVAWPVNELRHAAARPQTALRDARPSFERDELGRVRDVGWIGRGVRVTFRDHRRVDEDRAHEDIAKQPRIAVRL